MWPMRWNCPLDDNLPNHHMVADAHYLHYLSQHTEHAIMRQMNVVCISAGTPGDALATGGRFAAKVTHARKKRSD